MAHTYECAFCLCMSFDRSILISTLIRVHVSPSIRISFMRNDRARIITCGVGKHSWILVLGFSNSTSQIGICDTRSCTCPTHDAEVSSDLAPVLEGSLHPSPSLKQQHVRVLMPCSTNAIPALLDRWSSWHLHVLRNISIWLHFHPRAEMIHMVEACIFTEIPQFRCIPP